MSNFLYDDDAKAIAIPQVFSQNSQAQNLINDHYSLPGKLVPEYLCKNLV